MSLSRIFRSSRADAADDPPTGASARRIGQHFDSERRCSQRDVLGRIGIEIAELDRRNRIIALRPGNKRKLELFVAGYARGIMAEALGRLPVAVGLERGGQLGLRGLNQRQITASRQLEQIGIGSIGRYGLLVEAAVELELGRPRR